MLVQPQDGQNGPDLDECRIPGQQRRKRPVWTFRRDVRFEGVFCRRTASNTRLADAFKCSATGLNGTPAVDLIIQCGAGAKGWKRLAIRRRRKADRSPNAEIASPTGGPERGGEG